MALAPVQLHRRDEEAEILRRHIGQRMRPVFEHALVDALGLPQVGAPVVGDAAIENVMMAALDHVDGVDLHIAEMLDRGRDRRAARRRTAAGVSSRWARSQMRRASALVRGRGVVARGIARQCSRIRRT